jgi:hypothetical protein
MWQVFGGLFTEGDKNVLKHKEKPGLTFLQCLKIQAILAKNTE